MNFLFKSNADNSGYSGYPVGDHSFPLGIIKMMFWSYIGKFIDIFIKGALLSDRILFTRCSLKTSLIQFGFR